MAKDLEVGSFAWAVETMLDRKKVRRKHWKQTLTLGKNKDFFYHHPIGDRKPDLYIFTRGDYQATDWELAEEKKSLSDKIEEVILDTGREIEYIDLDDVRETLKELNEWLEECKTTKDCPIKGPTCRDTILEMVIIKLKEKFGEKLIII